MTKRAALVLLLIVLVLTGMLLWYLLTRPAATTPGQPAGGNPFGTPAGSLSGGTGTTQGSTTELTTASGQTVSVPDLTAGKKGFPLGTHEFYFVTDNQETQGDNAEYDILYGTDSSITIGLLKEPLGQSRADAEAKLRSVLGIPDAQICSLKVSVQVPYSINQFYAGQNLGLSFCRGATKLP